MDIIIDFDGTVVTHNYPNIGSDIDAIPVLKELIDNNHNLILFTMRSGKQLNDAIDWFKLNGIKLYGIQKNPTQHVWTTSPKAYGQLLIDDIAIGCPLKFDKKISDRSFVDWEKIRTLLKLQEIIK